MLLLLALLPYLADAVTSGCPYPPIPLSLDTLPYLRLDEEVFLHGPYLLFDAENRSIEFTLKQESVVKMYLAPHEVDIDLTLSMADGNVVEASLLGDGEEILSTTVPPGDYTIWMSRELSIGSFSAEKCPFVLLELAIVPKELVQARAALANCDSELMQLPTIDFSPLARNQQVKFSGSYAVQQPKMGSEDTVMPMGQWTFTTPTEQDVFEEWSIRASLFSQFLTSTLNVVLVRQDEPSFPDYHECLALEECVIGVNSALNEASIEAILLSGATYTIFLVDRVGQKDSTLSTCQPYHMEIDIKLSTMEEELIECSALRLPPSFNAPGFLSHSGRMHFVREVLIVPSESPGLVQFEIEGDSFMRVFASEHEIDIDLKIKDSQNNAVVSGVRLAGEDEGVFAQLRKGTYTLEYRFYGALTVKMCESFIMEVAIAPVGDSHASTFCSDKAPSFSGLSDALKAGTSYYAQPQKCSSELVRLEPMVLYETVLDITETSSLVVNIGSRFLYGDVAVHVHSRLVEGDTVRIVGVHGMNANVLDAVLEAGSYALMVNTSNSNSMDFPDNFPTCLDYTIELDVIPLSLTNVTRCRHAVALPDSFSTFEFETSPETIHFQGDVLIPPAASYYTSKEARIKAISPSFLRLYVEKHRVDIDLLLMKADGTELKSELNMNSEEVFVFPLQANTDYIVKFEFYDYELTSRKACETFNLEVMVEPDSERVRGSCAAEVSPQPSDLDFSGGAVVLDKTYSFTQGEHAKTISLDVAIPEGGGTFRAMVEYDFLWGDLVLQLLHADGEGSSIGVNAFNLNGIAAHRLPAGKHTLKIREPTDMPSDRVGCVEYRLILIFVQTTSENDLLCSAYPFPSNLTEIGLLDHTSGGRLMWQRDVLVPAGSPKASGRLQLAEASYLRVLVPDHAVVDVDLMLIQNGRTIARRVGFDAEGLFVRLEPGDYTLEFLFYSGKKYHCASVSVALGIEPVSLALSYSAFTVECDASPLSSIADVSEETLEYTRPYNGTVPYTHAVPFTVDVVTDIAVYLSYHFVPSGVHAFLDGVENSLDGDEVPVHVEGQLGDNMVFLTATLLPGRYAFTVNDPASSRQFMSTELEPITKIMCQPFDMSFSLKTSTQPPVCDTQPFPPLSNQEEDGSLRLFGSRFALERGDKMEDTLFFKVPVESVVRVFAMASSDDTDLDLALVFSNGTRLGVSSNGVERDETLLATLPPLRAVNYGLEVQYWAIDAEEECPSFHFEMAQKPLATLLEELRCDDSGDTNLLPSSIKVKKAVVTNEQRLVLSSDLFAEAREGGLFEHVITLELEEASTLDFSMRYDFLANGFYFVLYKDHTPPSFIARGMFDGEVNRDGLENFRNDLRLEATAGTYKLHIMEDREDHYAHGLETYCHTMTLSYLITPMGDGGGGDDALHVISVEPLGGFDLDPTVDLIITTQTNVGLPGAIDPVAANEFVTTHQCIYLSSWQETVILPSAGSLLADRRTFITTFSAEHLREGEVYVLHIFPEEGDCQTEGISMAEFPDSVVFTMGRCECTFGHCKPGNSTCVCDEHATGRSCDTCEDGYHVAATSCVPDTKCSLDYCNNNGECSDSQGYPRCTCDIGYTHDGTQQCSQCALGFTGYPYCAAIPEEVEEAERACHAPILPSSLNDLAYLGHRGDGSVHLQDYYFLDTDHATQRTHFSLAQPSYLRLFVEAHELDIDVVVRQVGRSDALALLVEEGGKPESTFLLLEGSSAKPANYTIDWMVFGVEDEEGTAHERCESFNLELAIMPTDDAKVLWRQMNTKCASALPTPPVPIEEPHLKVPLAGFAYNTGWNGEKVKSFSARSNSKDFFYEFPFEVSRHAGETAYIDAEIGYDFLLGDLGLLLTTRTGGEVDAHEKCSRSNETCTYGVNHHNINRLLLDLTPGNYSLFIYRHLPQLKDIDCSPFEFSLKLGYRAKTSSIVFCEGVDVVPSSFDIPRFLSEANGFLHVQEEYLLDATASDFTLDEESLFRAHVPRHAIDIDLSIYNGDGDLIATSWNPEGEELLVETLPAGSYTFVVTVFAERMARQCETFPMELAIAPTSIELLRGCPTASGASAPALPAIITAPFALAVSGSSGEDDSGDAPISPKSYFNFGESIVLAVPVNVTETSRLFVGVGSDFLRSDVEVIVTDQAGTTVVTGSHRLDYNHIDVSLPRGSYIMVVKQLESTLECTEYTFEMSLTVDGATDPWSLNHMGAADEAAERCGAWPVPTTLNTMRYLGLDGRVHFREDFQLVTDGYSMDAITITVEQRSLLRVYVAPHDVDIDLTLVEINEGRGTVLETSYDIFAEETVVHVLEPGRQYALELSYFTWVPVEGACLTFDMECAVVPLEHYDLVDPVCSNGGDSFPPAPPHTLPSAEHPDKWMYDSTVTNEALWVQQRQGEPRTHLMEFVVLKDFQGLFELSYDFAHGDMVLELSSEESGVITGQNFLSRNVIVSGHFPRGNYSLTIYEASAASEEVLGCPRFSFRASIDFSTSAAFFDTAQHVPASLDTIPYLALHSSVHLQGNFGMNLQDRIDIINFTLTEPSHFRVYTEPHDVDIDLILKFHPEGGDSERVYESTNWWSEESIAKELGRGHASLEIMYNPRADGSMPAPADHDSFALELAIASTADVMSRSGDQSECKALQAVQVKAVDDTFTLKQHYSALVAPASTSQGTSIEDHTVLSVESFTVYKDSLVFIEASYDFLLFDLAVVLTREDGSDGEEYLGDNARNLNVVQVVVPAGRYAARVYMPALSPFKCLHFDFEIIIQPAVDNPSICRDAISLPASLTNRLHRGQLEFYQERILLSGRLSTGLTVQHDTVLHVTTTPINALRPVTAALTSNGRRVDAHRTSVVEAEGDFLFVVRGSASTSGIEVALSFEYEVDGVAACPQFNVEISAAPITALQLNLLCTSPLQAPVLLQHMYLPSGDRHVHAESAIPRSAMSRGKEQELTSVLPFTVAKFSVVAITVAYNGLASTFALDLHVLEEGEKKVRARGWVLPPTYSMSPVDLRTESRRRIEVQLSPGDYDIAMTAHGGDIIPTIDGEEERDYCLPFVFDIQVAELSSDAHVLNVEPAGGDHLPVSDLEIDLDLTSTAYSCGDTEEITSSNDVKAVQAMKDAFTLTPGDGAGLHPSTVVGSGTSWKLVFSGLAAGRTHRLVLAPHHLCTAPPEDLPFTLPLSYDYTTLPRDCFGRGSLNAEGYCQCDREYVGALCDVCNVGYENRQEVYPPACVLLGDRCQVDTCGCVPGSLDNGYCTPRGVCDDRSGEVTCHCHLGFSGFACEQCAVGYIGPLCKPAIDCQCLHGGECNEQTGGCTCESKFAGARCEECAGGRSGENCDVLEFFADETLEKANTSVAAGQIVLVLLAFVCVAATTCFVRRRKRQTAGRYGELDDDVEDGFETMLAEARFDLGAEEAELVDMDALVDDDVDDLDVADDFLVEDGDEAAFGAGGSDLFAAPAPTTAEKPLPATPVLPLAAPPRPKKPVAPKPAVSPDDAPKTADLLGTSDPVPAVPATTVPATTVPATTVPAATVPAATAQSDATLLDLLGDDGADV